MQQANVVEAHAGNVSVLHKGLAGLWEFLLVLIVVADNRQDLLGGNVNRHPVRDFEAGLLTAHLMLVTLNVEFAVALVNLAVPVVRVHAVRGNALHRQLLALEAIQIAHVRGGQIDVPVHAQYLEALYRRWSLIRPVGNALGVLQVRRVVINNQIVSIYRLRDRPVPQGAEVNLLKGRATKAQHEQHAVGVGVILCSRRCQVMVQVFLKRLSKLVFIQRRIVIVVADFHRAVSRQHLRAGIGLKAQHRLQKEWVPHPVHALDRRSFCGASEAGNLNLEAK